MDFISKEASYFANNYRNISDIVNVSKTVYQGVSECGISLVGH